MVVCSIIVVVPSVGRARTIVITTHIRDRSGVHASLDHGGRTRGKWAMIIGKDVRIILKHPGLTSEDVRIKGVVIPSLLQAAL